MTEQQMFNRFWQVFVVDKAPRAQTYRTKSNGYRVPTCIYEDANHGGVGKGCAIGCQEGFQEVLEKLPDSVNRMQSINRLMDDSELVSDFFRGVINEQFLFYLQSLHDTKTNWADGCILLEKVEAFRKEWRMQIPEMEEKNGNDHKER